MSLKTVLSFQYMSHVLVLYLLWQSHLVLTIHRLPFIFLHKHRKTFSCEYLALKSLEIAWLCVPVMFYLESQTVKYVLVMLYFVIIVTNFQVSNVCCKM